MAVSETHLRRIAGILALVTAGIHLYWGIPRFIAYASVGVMPDPRPLAFVLSGHAIALGLTLVLLGKVDARRLYLPTILLMAVHVVSYVAWHTVLTHGMGAAGQAATDDHGHISLASVGPVMLDHLLNGPMALVSKATEIGVILLLGGLYVANWRSRK
jgi:hypothetical protein